ncbi:DMT family transporter [Melioribacter sp. OK-6-Me]|uniref:DMT family transporter n=1 Tax=unclassified Melioribacter TaxID=2627329 RepID=UPI003EDAB222
MDSKSRFIPVFEALFVTFLWSTSYIIIKWGLEEISPLFFAGLRYSLAFMIFLPFILRKNHISGLKQLTIRDFTKLILLGFVFYFATQGTQFIGLSLLPSVTVSLLLNFTPLLVLAMGIIFLNEKPTKKQIVGIGIFLAGTLIYFLPVDFTSTQLAGLGVMTLGVGANAMAAVLGRNINRERKFDPLIVTFVSLGFGSFLLLITANIFEKFPAMSLENWIYILWLAGINTALAFTLWNKTLRELTAVESSIINNTMLIQIAILSFLFLDENLSVKEIIGLIIVVLGAVLVQKRGGIKKAALKNRQDSH